MRRTCIAFLWFLAACEADFDPESRVDAPRVIGIVAEPPEIGFDQAAAVAATVSFPEQVARMAWTACAMPLGAAAEYACGVPEVPLASIGPLTALDGRAVDAGLDALRPAIAMAIEGFRSAVAQDDTCLRAVIAAWDRCGGGAPCEDEAFLGVKACLHAQGMDVSLHLRLELADGQAVDGYKRVRLRDPAPGRPPNRNPVLLSVKAGEAEILDSGRVEAAPGATLDLVPALADNSVETWADDRGDETTERVWITWLATDGDVEWVRTTSDRPESAITLPGPDEMPDEITVWVFVRDDRLGAGGMSFRIERAEGTP
jgi:hypothetical protein